MHDLLAELVDWPVEDFDAAAALVEALETDGPLNRNTPPSVVVFNDESMIYMVRVVELLKPRALIHLSDESGSRPDMVELARKGPDLLRQYKHGHFPSPPNLFQIPLGYMTDSTKRTSSIGDVIFRALKAAVFSGRL